MGNRTFKIGILGSRGIPNHYGGFEQFASYLSKGLVARGHEVWVYNSSLNPYKEDVWNGVQIIRKDDPEDRFGTFGQFIYDFRCLMDARNRPFDLLLQLGYTSSAIFFPIWPGKMVQVMHMDGLEWKRTKYTPAVQRFLKWMERLAAEKSDYLIADSTAIQDYLLKKYNKSAEYIAYGANLKFSFNKSSLNNWNLVEYEYFLVIARFVPENNIETIIRGYIDSKVSFPLVIVGDSNNKYGNYLKSIIAPTHRIIFTGPVFEEERLDDLRHFSKIYFHGHSVGGTNPSLLEAMSCGALIGAHENPFNRAILEENGYYFTTSDDIKNLLLRPPGAETQNWVNSNRAKIENQFSWAKIIDAFESFFHRAIGSEPDI